MPKSPRFRVDLARWPLIRGWATSSRALTVVQALALMGLLALVAIGLGVGQDAPASELTTLRKTNLATLAVWGLWWPGLILVTLTLGRVWCAVCPLELTHRLGDALARRLGWRRQRLSRAMRAGWWIVGAYLAMQVLVAAFAVHRVPHYTALVLLVLVAGALLSGLVFREPRAFCRAFCPAGALLSVYSREAPLRLDTLAPETCATCTTRSCVRSADPGSAPAGCASGARPFRRAASDACTLCMRCIGKCVHRNIGWGLRRRSGPPAARPTLRASEAAFVVVALGFVTHEVAGEVPAVEEVFHAVPAAVAGLVPGVPFAALEAFWFLVAFPALVWGLIAALSWSTGRRDALGARLLAFATGAAPIVAFAHLAKALAKIGGWGGFLPLALEDPTGLATRAALASGTQPTPGRLLGLDVVGALLLILTVVVCVRALRWSRRTPGAATSGALVGAVAATVVFAPLLVAWVTAS